MQSAPLRPEDRRAPHRIQLVPRTTRTDLSCCQQREAESGCFSVFFFFVALRASPLFTPSRGGVGPCVPRAGEKQISDLEFVAAATFRRLGGFFFFHATLTKIFFSTSFLLILRNVSQEVCQRQRRDQQPVRGQPHRQRDRERCEEQPGHRPDERRGPSHQTLRQLQQRLL